MSESIVEFTLPLDLYEQASDMLKKQGLTVEDAIVMFYEYVAANGKLPFDMSFEGGKHDDKQ